MQEELGHSFGNDSVFWISYEDFLLKFQHIDRTRLFREPDWRCCRRWIAVDVPWRTTYNEKFHIKLTKSSPLVIVLSQLDTRYFEGLVGQYFFRMHFRLHEQGSPDAEDYIVRSHGNYLMSRSVSVDLPELDAGNYCVFLSVQAWRDHNALSVEDVVKRELKSREENDKLAHVGQAYDIAHSKAAAHIKELGRLRKKLDQAKASDERKTGRRKTWAKRHLLKDIQRRQQAKNDEKKKRREAEREAERKQKEAANEKEGKKEDVSKPEGKAVKTETVAVSSSDTKAASPTAENSPPEGAVSESTSASTSGRSTPTHTPLDTPKSETTAEPVPPVPNVETLDRVAEPPISDVMRAQVAENDKESIGYSAAELKKATTDVDAVAKQDALEGEAKKAKENENENARKSEKKQDTDKEDGSREAEKMQEEVESKSSGKKQKHSTSSEFSDQEDEDNSSDSPIEDWEEWYSSDNLSTKTSRSAAILSTAASKEDDDSDDEKDPAPWNAICIVGIRVYTKDEDLELRVVMEGSNMSEDGMGEKGEPDLDNAQANAGGQRVKESMEEDGQGEMASDDECEEVKGSGVTAGGDKEKKGAAEGELVKEINTTGEDGKRAGDENKTSEKENENKEKKGNEREEVNRATSTIPTR